MRSDISSLPRGDLRRERRSLSRASGALQWLALGLVVLGGAASVGCSARPQAKVGTTTLPLPPPPAASVSASAAIDPEAWCRTIGRDRQRMIDTAAAYARLRAPEGMVTIAEKSPAWCVRAGAITWAFDVSLADYGPSAASAWGLLLEGPRILALHEGHAAFEMGEPFGALAITDIQKLEAVDVDGDGVAELTYLHVPDHPEGVPVVSRYWFKLEDGHVVAYDFPGATWTDVDGDGRLDGVSEAISHDHTACWTVVAFPRVRLLAHQLPGGSFSNDDEVAVAFARESCSERPTELVVRGDDGSIDEAATASHLECARLHGVTMAVVEKALAKACRRTPTDEEACQAKPMRDTCYFKEYLLQIAEGTPPLLAPAAKR